MKSCVLRRGLLVWLAFFAAGFLSSPRPLPAQATWQFAPPPPMAVPTTPDAQRNALNNLRSQVNWLQNATRTARNNTTGGPELLWQQFQIVRGSYNTFKMTLNSRQLTYGANQLAELDAGLDIIQEAFGNYQDDVASGRSPFRALSDLCQVLGQAASVWLQQLNRDCAQLRVGW